MKSKYIFNWLKYRIKTPINGRFFFLGSLISLFAIDVAEARIGGGGGFSSGRSNSRGGSGGGSGAGLYFMIRGYFILLQTYPIPTVLVTIIAGYFFLTKGRRAKQRYQSHIISKGVGVSSTQKVNRQLQTLCQRDPAFDKNHFENRIRQCFLNLQDYWSQGQMNLVRPFVTDGCFDRFTVLHNMHEQNGITNIVSKVEVKFCEIQSCESSALFDTIHLRIAAEAIDYFIDNKSGKRVKGSLSPEGFVEHWSFIRRRGTKTLNKQGLMEGYCPNCGNPLRIRDKAECGSCGSSILSGEYDWILAEITQNSASSPLQSTSVSGMEELKLKDSGFSPQAIEDRASSMFWNFHYARFLADPAPLKRCAHADFIEHHNIRLSSDGSRTFFADVSVGSMTIAEVMLAKENEEFDRIRLQVEWSGHFESTKPEKQLLPDYDKSDYMRSEMVLERHKSVRTAIDTALTSSHCKGCGAAATSDEKGCCAYCGNSFTDGRTDWVLTELKKVSFWSAKKSFAGNVYIPKDESDDYIQFGEVDKESMAIALVQMALADGVIDPKERALLGEMTEKLGISQLQINNMLDNPTALELKIPDTLGGRIHFMKALVQMSLIDGVLTKEEQTLLYQIGSNLELAHADVNLFVQKERRRMYKLSKKVLKNR